MRHGVADTCMKRETSSPYKLTVRTYACTLLGTFFTLRLQEMVKGARGFNGSYLLEEHGWLHRIGGMDQHGDILIRHDVHADGFAVRIEHRAGDEGLVRELEQELADVLTVRPNPPSPLKTRPPGMAHFFQMIQGKPLGRKVIVADAAVEASHDLYFDDYREARRELDFLARLPTLQGTHPLEHSDIQFRYHQAMQRYPDPKVCLHQGKKVRLPHRINAAPKKDGRVLTMHFALLPTGKVLVGWVEETPF